MAAASSASPNIEMKIMSMKSTRNTAISPTEDVSDITAMCLNRLPVRNLAWVSIGQRCQSEPPCTIPKRGAPAIRARSYNIN